jgi:hypothetical protein
VKNVKGQRNRQVLADIGNLNVVRIAEEKQISRPITRLTPLSLSALCLCLCLSLIFLLASQGLSCKTVG